MGLSHIVTSITVFVTGLVPMSCHKSSTAAATPPSTAPTTVAAASVTATNGPQHDLGAVTFTNHTETCVQLGYGKDCTFTPHVIDKQTLELTLELESKTAGGAVHDVSVTRVTAKTGQPLQVAVGDYHLSFTPSFVSE